MDLERHEPGDAGRASQHRATRAPAAGDPGSASDPLPRLALVLGALARSTEPHELVQIAVRQAMAELGARGGLLAVVRADGLLEVVHSDGIDPATLEAFTPVRLDAELPLARAARDGEAVWVETAHEHLERFPLLAGWDAAPAGASASVPLRVGDRVAGVLGVSFEEERTFGVEDRTFLKALGDVAALAVDRVPLRHEPTAAPGTTGTTGTTAATVASPSASPAGSPPDGHRPSPPGEAPSAGRPPSSDRPRPEPSPPQHPLTRALGGRRRRRLLTAREEADVRVRRSEQRYRSLVEATGAIVWHLSPEGTTRVSSRHGWEDFTGHPRHQGLGAAWLESFHPDDRDEIRRVWVRGLSRGEAFEVTGRLWHAGSDSYHWIVLRGVPVPDATDDAPLEWVGTVEDVHEIRSAQQAAAESAALLDTLLQDAPIGFAFVDRNLRFRLLNSSFAEFGGGTVEDHLGRRASEIVPDLAGAAEALMRGVIASGEPVLGLELRGATTAGVPGDRDWLVNYYPVRDTTGQVVGLGVTLIDLTERARLEAALREAEAARATAALAERLEEAQRIARTGSWEWDIEANQLTWSREMYRLFGLPVGGPNPPLEAGITNIHPDDLPGVLARYDELATAPPLDHRTFAFEHRLLLPDGRVRDVVVSGEIVTGPDGRPRRIRGASQDVTHQRESERALARAREELFLAEVRRQQEHRTIEALQRAAIPEQLPTVTGLELAATYDPAGTDHDVGGDWYDVLALDQRRLLCVVGDVSGHGLDAATLMVQLRNALRAYAFDDPGPAGALAALNRLVVHLDTGSFATAVVSVVDTATGEVRWSHAGHPPMLRFGPSGVVAVDDRAVGGPLLGVVADAVYTESSFALGPGEGLLAFTDGLVERRGEGIDVGLSRLADALASATDGVAADDHLDLEALCRVMVAHLFAGEVREDDVCQLALRRRPDVPAEGTTRPVGADPTT